jgi:REP element-mobilizing transposase RayT
MARKPRIEFEGAFYHVITRGNQRQKIFKDKDDLLKYLEILFNYKIRYKYFLYISIIKSDPIDHIQSVKFTTTCIELISELIKMK